MGKTIASTKKLTYTEAGAQAVEILTTLTRYRMFFSVSNNPESKWFHVVSIKDVDLVKHLIPACEIQEDIHKRRFAELFIRYE